MDEGEDESDGDDGDEDDGGTCGDGDEGDGGDEDEFGAHGDGDDGDKDDSGDGGVGNDRSSFMEYIQYPRHHTPGYLHVNFHLQQILFLCLHR